MRNFLTMLAGVFWGVCAQICYATDKYDMLPDLPEPLAAAQASSVSTVSANDVTTNLVTHSVGQEPNLVSTLFSLIFVILLIYATGIIYTKLNKFGAKTLKKQVNDAMYSQVSVVSTTPLGNNKTLHIVELDGKRMLIGASASSIHLIKDLGAYPPCEIEEGEYSKIEIPNIRIPKIEIPKIEIPGFTKVMAKHIVNETAETPEEKSQDSVECSEESNEEVSDGIIDKLFHTVAQETVAESSENIEHKVDPDEFLLYKKYL